MLDSKLSFLSWLAIANTTITSRNLYSIQNSNTVLLPKQMFSTFTFDRMRFSHINNIVSFQSILFQRCITEQNSFFSLFNYGPLEIKDSVIQECKIKAIGQNVIVTNSIFNLSNADSFFIHKSKKIEITHSSFSSTSSVPLFSISNSDQTIIGNCNFTQISSGALKFISSQSLAINNTIFEYCQATQGAAIFAGVRIINASFTKFASNTATKRGGAIFLDSDSLGATFNHCYFSSNEAKAGHSIATHEMIHLNHCLINGTIAHEILGPYTLIFMEKNKRHVRVRTPTSIPTQPPRSDSISYNQTEVKPIYEEVDYQITLIIVIATILCVVIIIGIAFFIYWRMKKQRNTIYASEKEAKDENEMGTVEIKSKYSLSKVYNF